MTKVLPSYGVLAERILLGFTAVIVVVLVAGRGFVRPPGADRTSYVSVRPSVPVPWRLLGPKDSPDTIILFTDYQCPACAEQKEELNALFASSAVAVMVMHFPLTGVHPLALDFAKIADCAGTAGVFLSTHEAFFAERPTSVEEARSIAGNFAATGGSSAAVRFNACIAGDSAARFVVNSLRIGQELGVRGTPSSIVGDSLYLGVLDVSTIRRLLRK